MAVGPEVGQPEARREADPLAIKRRLVHALALRLSAAGIAHNEAALRLGLSPRRLSNILYGHVDAVPEGQLLDHLARFGYDVEIVVRSREQWAAERGEVSLRFSPDESPTGG
ncbi:MAG: XRE family transcriptional regulator [Burkholderiales bacterium]